MKHCKEAMKTVSEGKCRLAKSKCKNCNFLFLKKASKKLAEVSKFNYMACSKAKPVLHLFV
jgi:hypothetical protein